jgi:hypothetical protein
VDDGGAGYEFDCSTLLTDGKLRVRGTANGMNAVMDGNSLVDVYTTDGVCLLVRKPYAEVRSLLQPGVYVLVSGNTSRKVRVE